MYEIAFVVEKEIDNERSLPSAQPKILNKKLLFKKGEGQVFIILLPAARFLILPAPPGILAARFLAAVILPPLDFFAII